MTVNEIRHKFIEYFKGQGHEALPSSSLIPKDDPSVLLTTAGMQQFKNWYSGDEVPKFPRVATIQKCVRTNDIEEVGDATHLTFFEMLGNFSFGGSTSSPSNGSTGSPSTGSTGSPQGSYFKEDAIKMALELIENELKVERSRIWVSIFEGDKEVPRDEESEKIWKSLGITDIREFGREDNFWGPTGTEGPCGPTSEIYVDDVEVWNLVFNEFYMQTDGVLLPLAKTGVDTGAGLERLAATLNKLPSVFETDELAQIVQEVKDRQSTYDNRQARIIADHLRTATFLLADGVRPTNLDRGYILRRLIRRAVRYGKLSGVEQGFCSKLAEKIIEIYEDNYSNLKSEKAKILSEIENEEAKFDRVIEGGLKKLQKMELITGKIAFDLFAQDGFPYELTVEIAEEQGLKLDKNVQSDFEAEFARHQEVSRKGMDKKFAGGLADKEDPKIIQYHTAAHLLLAGLRNVLGEHVHQKGSNITADRIRFDFSHDAKMTDEEKQDVENWVNKAIKENLPVTCEEMTPEEAKKSGAEGEFSERYGKKVTVYSIGGTSTDSGSQSYASREICGGPHVQNTSELGHFKIKKEESSSAGVRRIKAVLE